MDKMEIHKGFEIRAFEREQGRHRFAAADLARAFWQYNRTREIDPCGHCADIKREANGDSDGPSGSY